jgi:hypothetical protein
MKWYSCKLLIFSIIYKVEDSSLRWKRVIRLFQNCVWYTTKAPFWLRVRAWTPIFVVSNLCTNEGLIRPHSKGIYNIYNHPYVPSHG